MSKKYNKRGAGFFSSMKSTMTSMTLTCRQIWDKYSSQLKSLVDEIDAFYTANNMKNILQTLYKTDYVKSKVLDEFGSIKLQVQYLFDVMSGAKQSLSDPNGKMCSDFIHSDFEGKKAALTFDQYLQDLQRKLSNIRETMKTLGLSPASKNVTTNTNVKNSSNTNSQKKGWLSSAKAKITAAMPKTCSELWEAQQSELFSLVKEIQEIWDNVNMDKVMDEEELDGHYVPKRLDREQYGVASMFPLVKDRLQNVQGRMTNERFNEVKNNRVNCLYFIPDPDYDDFISFDSYLKTIKGHLIQIRETMQKLSTSLVSQTAGRKKTTIKSYITLKGKQKHYLVKKDINNHKYIRKDGNSVYLSNIRGKYLYVRD